MLASLRGEHAREGLRGLDEGIALLGPLVSLGLLAIESLPEWHRRTRATLALEGRVREGLARLQDR